MDGEQYKVTLIESDEGFAVWHSAHTPQSDDISFLEIWLGKLPENVDLMGSTVSLESPTVSLNLNQPDTNSAKTVLGGINFQIDIPDMEKISTGKNQGGSGQSAATSSPTTPNKQQNG